MPAYNVQNTRGLTVATISIASTTGSSFPIVLIGQGISLYGETIAENLYRMLENFANPTAPINPVEGQFWYNSTEKLPSFYNSNSFIRLATASNSMAVKFNMLSTANNIDFTTVGSVNLFQADGSGSKFHPTFLMLFPVSVLNITSPAAFNINISSQEDVMETEVITNPTSDSHFTLPINGKTRFATGSEVVKLSITTAASGSTGYQMVYNAALFGLINS